MKKILFLAVAVIALITTGCENLQPTQVSSKDLKDKVTVSGYARYTVNNGKGEAQKPELLTDQELVLYYGMKDAEGKMSYTHYALKTDEDGYFTIDLALQPGKVIIDFLARGCYLCLQQGLQEMGTDRCGFLRRSGKTEPGGR